MGLKKLKGLSTGLRNLTLSLTPKTWETAGDWDNAVSESGVAHEAVPNTAHSDASTDQMGYL
jgi:hypothetical protein